MGRKEIQKESLLKAFQLYESGEIYNIPIGTVEGLCTIHRALFTGLYSFAGKIRKMNISKTEEFHFANSIYLEAILPIIEAMPEDNTGLIVEKYVEMNFASPFMEGNGRSIRIWLNQMLRRSVGLVVDWRQVDGMSYRQAMVRSAANDTELRVLLESALTDRINDQEMLLKGLEHSFSYY